MVRALVILLGLAGALPALASTTGHSVLISQTGARTASPSFGSIMATPLAYSWTTGPSGSMVASNIQKGPGPISGEVIDVEVKRVVTPSKAAKAIARSLPAVGTALAIADLLEDLRIEEGPGDTILMDPGQPFELVEGWSDSWSHAFSGTQCSASGDNPAAVADAIATCAFQSPAFSSCPVYNGNCVTTRKSGNVTCTTQGTTAVCNVPYVVDRKWCAVAFACSTSSTDPPQNWQRTPTAAPIERCPQGQSPAFWDTTKCTTVGPFPPADIVDVEARLVPEVTNRRTTVIPDVVARTPVEINLPELDPVPAGIPQRETTTKPDGGTTVRDTVWTFGPRGDGGYDWSPTVTTRDYPPGETPPPPGEITDGTTTTGAPPSSEIVTCGLPNTPPCKIDENGTPSPEDPFEDPDSWFDPIRGVVENPQVADTSWSWAFALPTGCSVMTVGPFAGQAVSVDLCQYQPMIHDLLSMVWVAAGLWFAIGMVGRTLGST